MSSARANSPRSQQPATSDDVPPPPYTETDIYSASGSRSTSGRWTSSTSGEVIYTPPLSPRSIRSHQSNLDDEDTNYSSRLAAASAYFDFRPPTIAPPNPVLRLAVTVTPRSTPGNLPCPPPVAGHDVSVEDWQTFVNFLLPDHVAQANEAVVDRKQRANSTGGRPSSERSAYAEAQLGQISTPTTTSGWNSGQKVQVEQMVQHWNEGFFTPRGIVITPWLSHGHPELGRTNEPSAASHNTTTTTTTSSRPARVTRPGSEIDQNQPGIGPDTSGLASVIEGHNIGPVLRIGGFTSDCVGISYKGRTIIPDISVIGGRGRGLQGFQGGRSGCGNGLPGGFFVQPPALMLPRLGLPHAASLSTGIAARGLGAALAALTMMPRASNEAAAPPSGRQQSSDLQGHRGRQNDGIDGDWGHGRHGSRSRTSSVSSTSSVESLPAYEDLADEQLPVAKELLTRWFNTPGQAITPEGSRAMNEEIRTAGRGSGCGRETNQREQYQQQNRHNLVSCTRGGVAPSAEEIANLRREVKEMCRLWKAAKRSQRQAQRELKRQGRAARREWRDTRKDVRSAHRELKKEARNLKKEAKEMKREKRRADKEAGKLGGFGRFLVATIPTV